MKMWKAEPSLDYFKENSNPHLQMCNSQLFPLIALLARGKRGKKEFWASGMPATIREVMNRNDYLIYRGLMDARKIDPELLAEKRTANGIFQEKRGWASDRMKKSER